MKHLEELSRQRVEEAIQTGLRSQSAHRARLEHKQVAQAAAPNKLRQPITSPATKPGRFSMLIHWILSFGG
jgi:hypothetical protein